jgi:hypothetical protein
MPPHFPVFLAQAVLTGLALLALWLRVRRKARATTTVVMFVLDALMFPLAVIDLLVLIFRRKDGKQETPASSNKKIIAHFPSTVAIQEGPNGVVVVRRQGGSNYSEVFPK